MKCPHCKREISDEEIARNFASKGGKSGTGKAKARTSEQASAAAKARWAKRDAKAPRS